MAQLLGLIVDNLVGPGTGFSGAAASAQAVEGYARQAKGQTTVAFANGEILKGACSRF